MQFTHSYLCHSFASHISAMDSYADAMLDPATLCRCYALHTLPFRSFAALYRATRLRAYATSEKLPPLL